MRHFRIDGRSVLVFAIAATACGGGSSSAATSVPVEVATPSTTAPVVTTATAVSTIVVTTTAAPVETVEGVVIAEIHYDAEGNDNENQNDEWVRIENQGESAVDMSGWTLSDDGDNHTYTFAAGFALEPTNSVVVYTGCGQDAAAELYWCSSGTAVWNNDGDTATLRDAAGSPVDASTY